MKATTGSVVWREECTAEELWLEQSLEKVFIKNMYLKVTWQNEVKPCSMSHLHDYEKR